MPRQRKSRDEITPREIDVGERLLTAARLGETDAVAKLLKEGADVEYRDTAGFSPLHFAAWKGQTAAVEALVRAGAEIDAKNNYPGLTPMHRACQNGHADAVSALLKAGADKNLGDQFGDTPLHRACYDGNPACVGVLLAAGCEPDPANTTGDTPLMQVQARARQRIAPSLNGRFPLSLSLTTHAALARKAARNAHADCIAELVRTRRVSLTLGNRHGRTALHWAAYSGCEPAIAALVAAGAPVNQGNSRGFTALHHASENAHLGCVRALLAAGADPLATQHAEDSSERRTAAALAQKKGHESVAELLEQAMEQAIEKREASRQSPPLRVARAELSRPPRARGSSSTSSAPPHPSRSNSASSPSSGPSRPPTRSSAGALAASRAARRARAARPSTALTRIRARALFLAAGLASRARAPTRAIRTRTRSSGSTSPTRTTRAGTRASRTTSTTAASRTARATNPRAI